MQIHAFLLSKSNVLHFFGVIFVVDTFHELIHVIKQELTPHEMYTGTNTHPRAIRKNTA